MSPEQLELDPDPRPWFEGSYTYPDGSLAANVWVRAENAEEAAERAEAMLRDIGALPGGRMRESWLRFVEATT
jgi:hypothetical protein